MASSREQTIRRAAKRLRQAQQLHDFVKKQKGGTAGGRPLVGTPEAMQKGGPAGGRPVLPDEASDRARAVQAQLAAGQSPRRERSGDPAAIQNALATQQGQMAAQQRQQEMAAQQQAAARQGPSGVLRGASHGALGLHRVGGGNVYTKNGQQYNRSGRGANSSFVPVTPDALQAELMRRLKKPRRLPGRPVM